MYLSSETVAAAADRFQSYSLLHGMKMKTEPRAAARATPPDQASDVSYRYTYHS
jgi:hypothetical protein